MVNGRSALFFFLISFIVLMQLQSISANELAFAESVSPLQEQILRQEFEQLLLGTYTNGQALSMIIHFRYCASGVESSLLTILCLLKKKKESSFSSA